MEFIVNNPLPVAHAVQAPPAPELARAVLHELYAASQADAAALSGGAMLMCGSSRTAPILWIRHVEQELETGAPCAAGLADLGLDPGGVILLCAADARSVLQAGLEGARCAALDAVIIEFWGETRAYDLTASRRLALAAKASGVLVIVARAAATPAPSAAQTRWRVRSLPSRALAAQAPGPPAFELALIHARDGRQGLRYQLEWDRDARRFVSRQQEAMERLRNAAAGRNVSAPLPGAVVPLPLDRPGAERRRHAG